jgi:hypothetical protein
VLQAKIVERYRRAVHVVEVDRSRRDRDGHRGHHHGHHDVITTVAVTLAIERLLTES